MDGTKLEVGWYGGASGEGYFKIVHFQTGWNEPLEEIKTSEVAVVANAIERFALAASRPTLRPRSPDPEYHSISYPRGFPGVDFGSSESEYHSIPYPLGFQTVE